MLLGNFSEGYLDSVEQSITEYSYQYRTLYTDCYNLMEEYSKSSVQSGMMSGLATVSKIMGSAISKVPVINKSQLDENLIDAGDKLDTHEEKRTFAVLSGLTQNRMNVTISFVENIREINHLYNRPNRYLIDGDDIYIQQISELN